MFDVAELIKSGGLLLIALIIFGESGMFIGFFFPGDTLLITAGIFAAQGHLPIVETILVIAVAAILGDNLGYWIGKRWGRQLFSRPHRAVFRPEYVHKAEKFYDRWGSRTMLIAHFFPIVRTFAPAVAGIAEMPYRRFFIFDAIGDTAWAFLVTMLGYTVGGKIPDLDHYIVLAVIGVMGFTLAPTFYHIIKARRHKRSAKQKVKKPASEDSD